MLGIDPRAARATWTVLLILALSAGAYLARRALVLFVLALFFAYMLSPLVDLVERFTPRRLSRTFSLAIVYVALLAVIGGLGAWLGGRAVEQASNLATRLPGLIEQHQQTLLEWPVPEWLVPVRTRVLEAVRAQMQDSAQELLPMVTATTAAIAGVIGRAGVFLLVPILGFFFLKDGRAIRDSLVASASERHRPLVEDIAADVHLLLGQYIRALVILSAATFVAYLIYFELTGAPYGVLLAAISAPLEFIPVIGPLLASAIIILVSLFSGYSHILGIIVFLILYRLFQDYVLQPYLMSAGVALHPLVVILGALAGEQIAGVWGMFLSVPVIATLRIVLVRVRKRRRPIGLVSEHA
ncbi:MAG: AI-2E family transporter [Acidobacteria bacterium]|nr:AI-2E family transporter [Acidobacteriota bacterium]MBI3281307.1 AI-2E family transporter [Acidobacteriota bacterium]